MSDLTSSILPYAEANTAREVIGQYDLDARAARKAMQAIEREWIATSGRFYAYTVAHRLCAEVARNLTRRIYYTGDVSNHPGWFVVKEDDGTLLNIVEEPGELSHGRDWFIPKRHVGDVYRGHCDPRFVTEAAYNAYHTTLRKEA